MVFTYKIKEAIGFSIKTHEVYQKQVRKGKDVAYITHPLTVGIILARAGVKEDVVAAGILHDTIEDSVPEKKVSRDMLAKKFGENVADIVASVSEISKDLPWEKRKEEMLQRIATFSHSSLLVKSADIISNAAELIDDCEQDGDKVFSRFNAPKEKILQHYLLTITAIVSRWSESPLAEDLRSVARGLQSLNGAYFMFNYPAKIIEYRDYSEDMPLQCSICGWKGTPKESGWINTDSHFALDVSCPNCEKMLLVASYPFIKK